jgi:hypothetical protein
MIPVRVADQEIAARAARYQLPAGWMRSGSTVRHDHQGSSRERTSTH